MTQPLTFCLALTLPAARLLLIKLLSSTMHRRPLTWKNMPSTRRTYHQGEVLILRTTNLACMHITGITSHISNNYRASGIKDKFLITDTPTVEP
jgi:hypothetical protein